MLNNLYYSILNLMNNISRFRIEEWEFVTNNKMYRVLASNIQKLKVQKKLVYCNPKVKVAAVAILLSAKLM